MDAIFSILKEIEEKSIKSFDEWNEKILEISNEIYQDEKEREKNVKQIVSRVERLNQSVENTCKFVTGNLVEFEDKLKNVDQKGHNEIKEQLEKDKLLSEKQEQKIEAMEKLLAEMKDLQAESRQNQALIGEKNDDLFCKKTAAYGDLAKNHNSLNECRDEIASNCRETLNGLHQMQEANQTSLAKTNEKLSVVKSHSKDFNEQLVNLVHRNVNGLNMHQDYFNETLHQVTKTVQESNEKSNKESEGKHENLEKIVLDERKRLESMNTTIETYVKQILNKLIQESEGKLLETLGKCSDEIKVFNEEQLIKYEPTGSTPARKDYQFNRNLAATSPHDRLIKKMRLDLGNPVDLDASITILEVSCFLIS
jgi:kinesin family protein 11